MATLATIKILPQLKGPRGAGIIERYRAMVDVRAREQCWPWTGSINTSGYGRFKINPYEIVAASRFTLVIATKEEHMDLLALHSCDNPCCCNPNHLRWGTVADNVADMVERNRGRTGKQDGLSNGACKLRPGDLETIIARFRRGMNNKQISADLPVDHALVSRIRTGRSWVKEAAALGWVPCPSFVRKQQAASALVTTHPTATRAHDGVSII